MSSSVDQIKNKMKNNQKGFASIALVGIVVALVVVGYFAYDYYKWPPICGNCLPHTVSTPKLTLDQLKNTNYVFEAQNIKLVNGTYSLKPLGTESQANYFVKIDESHPP